MRKKIKKHIRFLSYEDLLLLVLIVGTWLKLLFINGLMFTDRSSLAFITFTIFSVLIIYAWIIYLPRWRTYFALFVSFATSFIIWGDLIYFRFFGSLVGFGALKVAGQTTDVWDSVYGLAHFTDFIFIIDILIVSIFLFIYRKNIISKKPGKLRVFFATVLIIISVITMATVLYIDRNTYLDKFLYHSFDINLTELRYGLFAAHGIDFCRTYGLNNIDATEEEKRQVVSWLKSNVVGQKKNVKTGVAKNKDIYLIQVESLQSFVINKKFEGQEITPNINKLLKESYFYKNGKSVIGGGQTSDSDFATNTSVYPLKDSAVFVSNGSGELTSLPRALSGVGYSTKSYHAYKRDFWNRGVAFSSLGYDHFYAADEYLPGENIIMGLNDEDFYNQTITKMEDTPKPTFNYLISLSSHFPFIMAEKYQTLKGDVNDYDLQTFHYYQAIHYADYALGKFIDNLKRENLYDDSLVVVYGDHPAKIGDVAEPLTVKTLDGTMVEELKKIPFIYKLPAQIEGMAEETETSQVDIMPTLLNLTGVKTNYPMFGKDILGDGAPSVSEEVLKEYSAYLIKYRLFDNFIE